MREILRTNNSIQLSWAQSVLEQAGVQPFHFDQHTSVLEGSISAIEQRLKVSDEDYDRAKRFLEAAEKDLEDE